MENERRNMSIGEMEALLQKKIDEVYRLRREIDRRKGEGVKSEKARSVNFEEGFGTVFVGDED